MISCSFSFSYLNRQFFFYGKKQKVCYDMSVSHETGFLSRQANQLRLGGCVGEVLDETHRHIV